MIHADPIPRAKAGVCDSSRGTAKQRPAAHKRHLLPQPGSFEGVSDEERPAPLERRLGPLTREFGTEPVVAHLGELLRRDAEDPAAFRERWGAFSTGLMETLEGQEGGLPSRKQVDPCLRRSNARHRVNQGRQRALPCVVHEEAGQHRIVPALPPRSYTGRIAGGREGISPGARRGHRLKSRSSPAKRRRDDPECAERGLERQLVTPPRWMGPPSLPVQAAHVPNLAGAQTELDGLADVQPAQPTRAELSIARAVTEGLVAKVADLRLLVVWW